ncbi:MAG: hypothetical protein ACPGNT_08225 [Rhodospirillales bacterium]
MTSEGKDPLPGTKIGSHALSLTLDMLETLKTAGLTVVQFDPTTEQCEAGAKAGGVDPDTAARIFRAMISV